MSDEPQKKRTPIPKKLRFEILKLHKFACQYCGGAAPEVLLHIDHIIPIAEGGTNDFTNLTVACQPCNLGKGKVNLDDNTSIQKSKLQMDLLQERKEQLDMMLEWQKGLQGLKQDALENLVEHWENLAPGFTPSDHGRRELKKIIRKFNLVEIFEAMEIAAEQYLDYEKEGNVTRESWIKAFDKIKGICRVKRESKDNPQLERIYYIKGILRNRCDYFQDYQALNILKNAIDHGIPLGELESMAKSINSWTQFNNRVSELFEQYE